MNEINIAQGIFLSECNGIQKETIIGNNNLNKIHFDNAGGKLS